MPLLCVEISEPSEGACRRVLQVAVDFLAYLPQIRFLKIIKDGREARWILTGEARKVAEVLHNVTNQEEYAEVIAQLEGILKLPAIKYKL
ncbi:MAG: hypothetical protein HWN65_15700 [Candidatus Helarchaeota archaeon]|nr:hypothetical protein [Candidatus Helarchaeota archaeon]